LVFATWLAQPRFVASPAAGKGLAEYHDDDSKKRPPAAFNSGEDDATVGSLFLGAEFHSGDPVVLSRVSNRATALAALCWGSAVRVQAPSRAWSAKRRSERGGHRAPVPGMNYKCFGD